MLKQIEYIVMLQDVFSISNKDLAYILDKNRSDICSYIEGKKASDAVIFNLERLVEIAKVFEQLNIERLDTFLYRELVDGQTLIDFLKESISVVFVDRDKFIKFIDIIKTTSDKEKETRQRSRDNKNLRSLQDVMSEFSTPIMCE